MSEDTKYRREIVLINQTDAKEKAPSRWSRLESISKTLSVAAIPIVLAAGGWFVQRHLQHQAVSKDYVQLAVSILREPDQSKVSPELRAWAVALFNEYSAIKLNQKIEAQLKSGEATLPSESFTAISSADLTPERKSRMQTTLTSFQSFLKGSGFSIASGEVKYEVLPGDKIDTEDGAYFALYESKDNTMKVASKYADEIDLIMHEYMRRVLIPKESSAPISYSDPRWWSYHAIDSGLAAYFPCSFNDQPIFAKGHKDISANLKNRKKFGSRPGDMYEADATGHQVWGGAFWELREIIGKPSADKLLASAWTSWQPSASQGDLFVEFVRKLIETDKSQGGQHVATIQDIFRRRGLEI